MTSSLFILYFGKTAHFIYKKFWRNWLKKIDRIDLKFLIKFFENNFVNCWTNTKYFEGMIIFKMGKIAKICHFSIYSVEKWHFYLQGQIWDVFGPRNALLSAFDFVNKFQKKPKWNSHLFTNPLEECNSCKNFVNKGLGCSSKNVPNLPFVKSQNDDCT